LGAGGFILHQGENFFKLVNDKDELTAVIGQDELGNPEQAARVPRQLIMKVSGLVGGDFDQGDFQFIQGMCPWDHVNDEPAFGTRQITPPEGWDQPRPDNAGFAAPAGADNGKESPITPEFFRTPPTPRWGGGWGEGRNQFFHQSLPAKKMAVIGGQEGPETFVRIDGLGQ
jgi:hypothetical protein